MKSNHCYMFVVEHTVDLWANKWHKHECMWAFSLNYSITFIYNCLWSSWHQNVMFWDNFDSPVPTWSFWSSCCLWWLASCLCLFCSSVMVHFLFAFVLAICNDSLLVCLFWLSLIVHSLSFVLDASVGSLLVSVVCPYCLWWFISCL